MLIAHMTYSVKSSMGKSIPSEAWFKPLTVLADGSERRPPSAWSTNISQKDFSLGRIEPGEVVKVDIGRKLESVSRFANEGTINEDIEIQFGLQDVQE
jgi:hypothetical protein